MITQDHDLASIGNWLDAENPRVKSSSLSVLLAAILFTAAAASGAWIACGLLLILGVVAVLVSKRRHTHRMNILEAKCIVGTLLAEGKTDLRQATDEQMLIIERGLDATS